MSQDISLDANINQTNVKTQKNQKNLWAHDDVHRVAMRQPALYQTKRVPSVSQRVLGFGEFGSDGAML
jgi:hypothetical protein